MPIYFDAQRRRWRFQLRRSIGGRRVRINQTLPAGWNRARAESFADQETARILAAAAGIDGSHGASPEIEAAVERYLAERVPQLKSRRSVIEDLAAILPYYAGRHFGDLPRIAREYARDAAERIDAAGNPAPLAAATVRKRISLLRAACRWGWKRHGMGLHDPGERIVTPPVRNERQVYLERADVLRAARHIRRSDARAAVLAAYYSGMRLSEILAAQVIDTPAGLLFHLADSKNGQPRLVPVHPRLAVYAPRWPLQQRRAWLQRAFLTAVRALGLGAVHFHDLRHSAASALVNAGTDLYTVGALLGHKSAQSTQRYAHLSTATLARAVARIGRQKSAPQRPKKAA